MFITPENFRSRLRVPESEADPGHWRAAEVIPPKAPWFILNFFESEPFGDGDDKMLSQNRTILVHNASEMARIVRSNAHAHSRCSAVFAVLPHMVGNFLTWKLQQLRSVLVALHPDVDDYEVEVLETVTGFLVPTYTLDIPVNRLRILQEKFRCPLPNTGFPSHSAFRAASNQAVFRPAPAAST